MTESATVLFLYPASEGQGPPVEADLCLPRPFHFSSHRMTIHLILGAAVRDGGRWLVGAAISSDMIAVAQGNAKYVQGSGDHLPLPDTSFDAVLTTSSLHEWVGFRLIQ